MSHCWPTRGWVWRAWNVQISCLYIIHIGLWWNSLVSITKSRTGSRFTKHWANTIASRSLGELIMCILQLVPGNISSLHRDWVKHSCTCSFPDEPAFLSPMAQSSSSWIVEGLENRGNLLRISDGRACLVGCVKSNLALGKIQRALEKYKVISSSHGETMLKITL